MPNTSENGVYGSKNKASETPSVESFFLSFSPIHVQQNLKAARKIWNCITGSKSSKQDQLPGGDCCYGLSEEGQRNCCTWLKFFLEIQHVLSCSWVLLGFAFGFWGRSCIPVLDFLLRGLHWKLLLPVLFSGQLPTSTMFFQKAVHIDVIEVVGNSSSVSASAAVIHTKAQNCLVHMFFTCKIRINHSLSLLLINYFGVPPICCKYTYHCSQW